MWYCGGVDERRQYRNLVLIGFMATGKSSVGRLLARRLGFDFIDTDAWIEARLQRRISEVFAQEGEAWFREYERKMVQELAEVSRTVISTGGGLAAQADNLACLKRHALVVCLWGSPETIWSRARRNTRRPLLNDPDPLAKIHQLLNVRVPFYKQADVLINTERRSVALVAQQVFKQYQLAVGHVLAPG